MHKAGKLFPRSDRSPAIKPTDEAKLSASISAALPDWRIAMTQRISSGFYKSQAMEIVRK
jgi:magnesium-protoporphyrin O-methyltransferase